MDKVIIYGAGQNGQKIYHFFKLEGMIKQIECFCDTRWKEIGNINGIPVKSYEEVKDSSYAFIISIKGSGKDEVENLLKGKHKYYRDFEDWLDEHYQNRTEYERIWIAVSHIDNSYFEEFDNDTELDVFWNINSDFYKMFQQLNLENVIELACGKGRHVPKYIESAGHITLVDILESNLKACKSRFGDYKKISYYYNNGRDLQKLESGRYSALFTYDAMVHFEMLDVYHYLKETYRVLESGAMALFHHSNLHTDYKTSFHSNEHCRNFMSKDLFAHLAWKCGFEIVDQKVIDWGRGNGRKKVPELDCITLVRKAGG